MAVCAIRIGPRGRNCLGNLLLLLNMSIAVMGLLIILSGAVLIFLIRRQKDLLKGYNYKKITNFVFGMGAALIIFHLLGGKICYDCGNKKKKHKNQTLLIPFIALLILAVSCVLALSVECSKSIHALTKGFEKGFAELMEDYSQDMNKKREVDMLHMKHRCCGSTGFRSWIEMAWYPAEYIRPEGKKLKKGTNENPRAVPFTCCNPDKMGPCIHDIVEIARPGYKKNGGKSFYQQGCGEAVMVNIKWLLRTLSSWCLLPFFIQLMMIFLVKYLYTSITNAIELGDERGPGYGYLLSKCPCTACEFCECDIEHGKKKTGTDSDSD